MSSLRTTVGKESDPIQGGESSCAAQQTRLFEARVQFARWQNGWSNRRSAVEGLLAEGKRRLNLLDGPATIPFERVPGVDR